MTGKRAGYSLLEVLIAFVVMALVLGILLPAQSRLLGRAAGMGETLLAQDYAESLLAEARVKPILNAGTRTSDYRAWQREERVEIINGPEPYYLLTVTIRRNGRLLATARALRPQ